MSVNTQKGSLRFGFVNINGLTSKVKAVSDFFKAENLDILFMVETWLLPNAGVPLKGVFLNMHLSEKDVEKHKGGRIGREGILVLVRPEVQSLVKVVHVSETKRWVLLKVEEYFVVCCYFNPSVDNDEILEMFNYIYDHGEVDLEYTMFVGDFNARMRVLTGDSYQNARGTWFAKHVLDAFQLNCVKPVKGKWTTITSKGRGITDHLLSCPDSLCLVEDLCVHDDVEMDGSDHRPMTWSVHMHSEYEMPTIVRWNLNRLKQPHYAQKCSQVLHETFFDAFRDMIALSQEVNTCELDDIVRVQESINSMYDVFVKWLELACSVSIGKAYFDVGVTCNKFDNDRVEYARRVLQRTCRQVADPLLSKREYKDKYAQYKEASAYYKEVCRERRIELYEEHVEEMAVAGNRVAFQKRVSSMKARAARAGSQLDPERMYEYVSHFASTFGKEPKGEFVECRRGVYAVNAASCVIDMSVDSVEKMLGVFANGKAAGPDGIYVELLKHESGLACQLLSLLFQVCYKYAVVPKVWCKANVALIFKNKGNIKDVANYRPISLTCTVRRLYERMLLVYMVPCTEEILHPSQGGFRPKRSTLHQCYALDEVMMDNPDAIHAFLDLKAAYDCVNRGVLWRDMKAYGVNEHMIAVCQSLFDFNEVNLVVNGKQSEGIRCARGLLQGSSMSPLLFNVYINSLLVLLDKSPKVSTNNGVLLSNCLFFADDGALHARSRLGMQSLLDVCSQWADGYGMEFASGKCAVMWDHEEEVHVDFQIQGGVIPTVETFVYLGVECNPKGMLFDKKQKERCASMLSTARFLKAKGMNALGWRLSCRVLVYKSFLRPIMEYGCALMRKPNCEMLSFMEKAQNSVLNMLLSCSRSTSKGGKLKLLQIETMRARVTKLQYGFFKSLSVIEPTDAPASVLWHGAGGMPVRRTKLQKAALANPIFRHSVDQGDDPEAMNRFMEEIKIRSMEMYDKTSSIGKRDIAASIQAPARLGKPSVYLDPSVRKDDQHVIMCLRLGAFAFHQDCEQCGKTVTRAHAMECSGEEARLQRTFADLHARYVQSPDSDAIIFQDFLLNTMDDLYASRSDGDRERALVLLEELSKSARRIRSSVSGYIQSADGRAWYHPLKSKHKIISGYVHYRQKAHVGARREAIRAAHPVLRVGRPPRKPQPTSVAPFDPPP